MMNLEEKKRDNTEISYIPFALIPTNHLKVIHVCGDGENNGHSGYFIAGMKRENETE